jgi:hypothetical protein
MTTPDSDSRHGRWAAVGYLVFATGSVLGIWLAWRAWKPGSDENPLAVLVLVWVIAGASHLFVRRFWRACVVSAAGCVLGYVALAVALTPNPFLNEMFGAGMIEVGLFGFLLSMVMGLPVAIHRRPREAPGLVGRRSLSPTVVGTIGIIFGVVGGLGSLLYFARPALLLSAEEFAQQMELSRQGFVPPPRQSEVPPWFAQYCLAIGAAGMIASVLYVWGSVRLLRLREQGATLFMVGAFAYLLVGASIATAGVVSSSAGIREDRLLALGSVVANAALLLVVWRWRHRPERPGRTAA